MEPLEYGFQEIDFTGEEGVLEVTVFKLGPNKDNYISSLAIGHCLDLGGL